MASSHGRRIFVGIDFGTTFSSIAYAISDEQNQANGRDCRVHYSNVYDFKGYQVPTKVPVSVYTEDDKDTGSFIEWFKLSLLHRDNLEHDIRVSKKFDSFNKAREALDISAVNVTGKYLRSLWEQFLKQLSKDIENVVKLEQCHLEVTMTVPNFWPLDARTRLREAVESAGILDANVHLVPDFLAEGEASAIALLSVEYNRNNVEVGKRSPSHISYIMDAD
ncbi:hypothetical protein IL306_014186 [Fusarium sp. DS 682]|nr:hypothetical protein IL306_014186 [Fusarium sp. DS 682]